MRAAHLEGAQCPVCGEVELTVSSVSAYHDRQVIDVVVECQKCDSRFNSFIALSEMEQIESL